MRLSVAGAGWLAVGAQALLLVVVAVLVKRTADDTLAAAVKLTEPYEVNLRLERVTLTLSEAEDGLDVYLDDPTPTRGAQYDSAATLTLTRLGDLSDLVDVGLSAPDFAAVEQAVHETLATFAKIKALRKDTGLPAADTKTPLYAAYRRIAEVRQHERERIRAQEAGLDREVARLDWSLLGAALVALGLQASVIVLVERDQRRRRALQSALRSQNAALEATVAERTASLTQAKDELAWVSRRALQLQERERQHLALELHDQIGQQLAALGMILQHVEAGLENRADKELIAHVRDGREVARTTYGQIHDMAVSLRPAMLDRLGLVPTLEWYARQQAQRSRCRIDVHAAALPPVLSTDLLTAAFRIAQEAVSNALRHAQPRNIDIRLAQVGTALHLSVQDDGAGFDVQATLAGDPAARSFGLLGMRERANAVGGTLSIASRPGAGTTITATLPLVIASAAAAEPQAASAAPAPAPRPAHSGVV